MSTRHSEYIQQILYGSNLLAVTKLCNWISFVTGRAIYPNVLREYIVLDYESLEGATHTLRVRFPARACVKRKYRGLDMFGSDGYPLTTIDQVRKRRRELIPRPVL